MSLTGFVNRPCCLALLLLLGLLTPRLDAHPAEGVPPHALGGIFPRISADGESFLFSYHGSIWLMNRRTASCR